MKATCGARAGMMFGDHDAGTRVLAISRPDGTFNYADIGTWADDCVLDFESGDGSHDPRRLAISDLCRHSTGDEQCLAIENISIDLLRRREPSPPFELHVKTTPTDLELRTDDAFTCRTPCEAQVAPGLHRFELFERDRSVSFWREQAVITADTELTVRYQHHRSRQEVAGWFLLPVGAAVILLPIGLVQKNDEVLWTSAGLAAGGGVGFLLVWKSDDVQVTVRPALPQKH